MHQFIIQRLIQSAIIVIVVSLVVFLFVHASGDPAALLVPEQATPEDVANYRRALGLDRPIHEQYLQFMGNFWFSDAVKSFRFHRPLLPLVLQHLQFTLILAGLTIVISSVLAVPLGIFAALRRGSVLDVGIRIVAVMGQSMPSFWVAMLLMLILAVHLRLFPVSGLGVKNIVLPTVTLAFFQMAVLLRLVRSELLEVMGQDYVRTARAKGVPERWVTVRHGLKNAAIPVITVMGLQFGALVQGAIVVEPIFAWPGLGWLLVESIAARDFPVVVAGAIIAAVFVTLVNLAVDLLYGWLDPRIRVN
jgi:ABC-type dipeptide/oligopeptide/nickel transport system permease component